MLELQAVCFQNGYNFDIQFDPEAHNCTHENGVAKCELTLPDYGVTFLLHWPGWTEDALEMAIKSHTYTRRLEIAISKALKELIDD